RHGVAGDRFKLYAETPEGDAADRLAGSFIGRPFLYRRSRLLMVGWEPAPSRVELYFLSPGLERGEIRVLLQRGGLAEREAELVGVLDEAWDCSAERELARSHLGYSLSCPLGRPPDCVSLFKRCRGVLGGDGNARDRLLELAKAQGGALTGYER